MAQAMHAIERIRTEKLASQVSITSTQCSVQLAP